MKKTAFLIGAVLLVALTLLLMGMGGAGSPGQEPADSRFNAKIRDTSNNEVRVTSVTFDGKTSFNVLRGKGRIQIPLENISRIELKEGSVCLTLKGSGTMCDLKTNSMSKVYGKVPYGWYQIAMKDVSWIELTKAEP
jgi:hypothetical protein